MTARRIPHPSTLDMGVRGDSMSAWLGRSWPQLVVSLAGVAAMLWAGALLWQRIDGLATPPYDLAFFQQVVWNVGTTGAWVSDFHEGSFLGLHFSPILIVPAAIERLVGPDVRLLSLLHAIGVGALGPAAFLFIRAVLRPSRIAGSLAAALAIGLPIWATMQGVLRADFHPELFGVVFALLAGWAGLTGRPLAMWALALMALGTREDVAYAVAVIGLVVAVRGRGPMRRQGWVLSLLAVAWGLVVFGVVMPAFRDGAVSDTDRYYRWLGNGPSVLLAPFAMPDRVFAALTRPAPWFIVAGMVIALVGLPFLRPRWLALLLPPLAAVLLSGHSFQAALLLQYPLILLVPLLAAAAMGARRALAIAYRKRRRARESRRTPLRPVAPLVLALVAMPALAGAWVQGSMPPFDDGDPAFAARPRGSDELRVVAANVPPEALLITDEGLMAPLAGRSAIRRLSAGGNPAPGAFLLIDRSAWSPTPRYAERRERILATLPDSGRSILVDDGRFILWGPELRAPTP